MPNYCDYHMKVVGYPSSIGKFIEVLNQNYNYGDFAFLHNPKPHLYRVFETNLLRFERLSGALFIAEIAGYCAWSVYSCMMEGPHTYYNDNLMNPLSTITSKHVGTRNYYSAGTSLLQLSKNLNLLVEVFSDEPGMCFQEHIFIDNYGNPLVDDSINTYFYYIEETDTFEDFIKEYPDAKDLDGIKELFLASKKEGRFDLMMGGYCNEQNGWEEPWQIKENLQPMVRRFHKGYLYFGDDGIKSMAHVNNPNHEYSNILERSAKIDETMENVRITNYEKEMKSREERGYKDE